MLRVYVLRGGMAGWDGPWTSFGMDGLAKEIAIATPGVIISVHNWSDYAAVEQSIRKLASDTKVVLVGYSGGGWKAEEIANAVRPRPIALVVALDPSPAFAVKREGIGKNVQHAICYNNTALAPFGAGGGVLIGPQVEVRKISENHLSVQFDATIRAGVVAAIRAIA